MVEETLDDLIARVDPDRYVAALFAPREKRAALMALYAFDHEVSRIAAIVREPMVGHIRLGWWREQVGAIYGGGVVLAPVAVALADVVRAYGLPRDVFDAYLDARGYDFEQAPFEDAAALERYAVAVSGGIVRLGAFVLGGGGEAAAAEQAGIAFACARLSMSRAPDALAVAERAMDRFG
ncbi:MAG: squalene/phytoene synthase family protein, partial [Micropepsaceae bacterium]